MDDFDDAVAQKLAWKLRVIRAVVLDQFDKETLVGMIHASWHEAHSEGLHDAVDICRAAGQHKLADALLMLDAMNKQTTGDA